MRMTPMMWIYAAGALAGAIVPWYFNLRYLGENGRFFTPTEFFNATFANTLVSSAGADFWIGSTSTLAFIIAEARRLKMRWWLYVVIALLVAWACAAPLFLLLRARKLQSMGAEG